MRPLGINAKPSEALPDRSHLPEPKYQLPLPSPPAPKLLLPKRTKSVERQKLSRSIDRSSKGKQYLTKPTR